MKIREYIKENILLFDGAMGTYYSSIVSDKIKPVEHANIDDKDTVLKIHKEYILAGAKAVKTNTFGANIYSLDGNLDLLEQIIKSGYVLAEAASENKAYVFADIGPIQANEYEDVYNAYKQVADIFIREGAKNFLFETLSNSLALSDICKYIKSVVEDAYIIVSFAVFPDGYTRDGSYYKDMFEELDKEDCIDALGLNCVSSAGHLLEIVKEMNMAGKTVSVMPNAGYPTVKGNRTYYNDDSKYYSKIVHEMINSGVRIVGGCCGTTPEFIKEIKKLIAKSPYTVSQKAEKAESSQAGKKYRNIFWEKLNSGKKVIAIELDSPKDCDLYTFMHGARSFYNSGADIITIADCPIARARMDSSLLACKIKREIGIDALPHMTCRDRNINAIKALLLGLNAENIHNVLAITGDPIPSAQRDEVSTVYQFNSRKLIAYINSLNSEVLSDGMTVYAALNVNAGNFNVELKRAKQKEEYGAKAFLTQPIFTQEAINNIMLAKKELNAKILGGIIPIVSENNARFMNSQIHGISIPEKIIELYIEKDRQESEELAVELSVDMAKRIHDYVDGFYLMTPFYRISLMERIISRLKAL